jgi:hypothetical protein
MWEYEKTIRHHELCVYLESIYKEGVPIYLEGRLSTPQEIIKQQCVNEDMIYMPDYIISETGKLLELRYDRISEI